MLKEVHVGSDGGGLLGRREGFALGTNWYRGKDYLSSRVCVCVCECLKIEVITPQSWHLYNYIYI